MRLAALNVAALTDQLAHLMRRDGQFALRADIQGWGDQEIVAPSHPFC